MAPPHSIATLTLSFGLVAIPVKLYPVTRASERIAFHFLRRTDGSRVKQQYIAAADGKPVERSALARGYEFAKDKYVMFTDDEIKALEDKTSTAIAIGEFVPLESVDPMYFDVTYYLAPDKGGAKPYALLGAALRKAGQCAIGRWISRGKEHVVAIRPIDGGLALHQLHFMAELRGMKELGIESTPVSDAELKLADQLIGQLRLPRFKPEGYADEFTQRVKAAIDEKIQGKEVSLSEAPAPADGNVLDLMAALRASLHAPRNHATSSKVSDLRGRKAKRVSGSRISRSPLDGHR